VFSPSAFRILIAYGGPPPAPKEAAMASQDVPVGPEVQLESESHQFGKPASGWRRRVHEIVFQSDTSAGKLFDIVLIAAILLSVAAAMADSVAVLPTYLAAFFPDAALLIDVRILRLLRIFRTFKLTAYLSEFRLLGEAMAASMRKIMVFLSVVVMIVLIVGTASSRPR
jgi:voltage-gated potassium channel